MVRRREYRSFSNRDDLSLCLQTCDYDNHCVLEESAEAITVILYDYSYALTSHDRFGERYVIRWLSEEESERFIADKTYHPYKNARNDEND